MGLFGNSVKPNLSWNTLAASFLASTITACIATLSLTVTIRLIASARSS